MRDPEIVKEEFRHRGLSVSGWAKRNGFSQALVYQVLSGKRAPVRGESYRIAVQLGLVDGREEGYEDLESALKQKRKLREMKNMEG
ncbi:DNA-binding protein [Marinobacter salicampi]|uniref:DNA-binding protein n=1 Tax=Marinobacter salicampi TaxID=435907 RepID=UPI001408C868